uniref:Uncharacterized protein n=1 Tax=viral metagenome TaxID=1070528 RepID=A0A6M3LRW6_9ZZZZ
MKDGDRLVTLCRLASLEELVTEREKKAEELRLEIWRCKESETK